MNDSVIAQLNHEEEVITQELFEDIQEALALKILFEKKYSSRYRHITIERFLNILDKKSKEILEYFVTNPLDLTDRDDDEEELPDSVIPIIENFLDKDKESLKDEQAEKRIYEIHEALISTMMSDEKYVNMCIDDFKTIIGEKMDYVLNMMNTMSVKDAVIRALEYETEE